MLSISFCSVTRYHIERLAKSNLFVRQIILFSILLVTTLLDSLCHIYSLAGHILYSLVAIMLYVLDHTYSLAGFMPSLIVALLLYYSSIFIGYIYIYITSYHIVNTLDHIQYLAIHIIFLPTILLELCLHVYIFLSNFLNFFTCYMNETFKTQHLITFHDQVSKII